MPRHGRFPAGRRLITTSLALVAGASLVVSACATRTWDTSEVDDLTSTTAVRYPRTATGLSTSLAVYLSTVGEDLDQWAAPRDEAECAAGRIVRRLTVDRLLDLGYDPQDPTLALDYTAEERTAVVNVLTGCIDFSQAIVETYSSYLKLPLTQSNCMAQGVDRLGLTRDMAGALADGKEPDPFAEANRFGAGMASLAVECMEADDLLPSAPLPPLPGPDPAAPVPSTTTTEPKGAGDDGLEGIVPGGPLDTTTTEATTTTTSKG